ncbi:AfsR/SARP family transcriptional regulator [Amycolatopsis regifaucium]|uniref:SARP family transcriptional regulator n=1 Tax=Amycolatopsis regifaucium TaxID=546365 RepID=A0A154MP88_9PSEU|nr:BTAD domain-containing putative transcriptional regulator [Amycolatopsis regifaucium]KZB85793.1 SARP family transcriptional regulator [Amycolatopsis regifaucium]OKA10451.1 SARP family transcriptional regulator [Amycolatopsis regifaucium]SFI77628.1 DNA-binding transcriptional activator of the SARP family [Amycolatopsis regifaucium]
MTAGPLPESAGSPRTPGDPAHTGHPSQLAFFVLGPLEAQVDGVPVRLGGRREQRLLACLLINAGRLVPASYLIGTMWPDRPPKTAVRQVSNAIARLRHDLGVARSAVVTTGSAYRIVTSSASVDSVRFEADYRQGAELLAAGLISQAAAKLTDALALWRGPAFDGLEGDAIEQTARRLDEERLAASELLIGARLRLGETDAAARQAFDLAAWHPTRETLQRLTMLALYRAGRGADALRTFDRSRMALAEELGVDPGTELSALHQQILRTDPELMEDGALVRYGVGGLRAGADTGGRREDADAQKALFPRPAQLPADLPAFGGRAAELRTVLEIGRDGSLAGPRLIAIDGMPGVGKTALAVHAAHLLAPLFPDGQLFVNLEGFSPAGDPVDPAAALEALLRSLGIQGSDIPAGTDQRAALFRSCLAGKRVLLVLDNAISAAQVSPLLPGAASCCVLITSRTRLADLDGAELLSLEPFSRADAVDLLGRIVGPSRLRKESPDAADQVASLCGDLPLALAVTASRLRARSSWTLDFVARQLRDERNRFGELTAGERDVAGAFRVSYLNLTEAERRVFRRLSHHPGAAFDLHSTAALAEVNLAEARRLAERLVDVNLLRQPSMDRYEMHDLLRSYGRELLLAEEPEHQREAMMRRLFDYYRCTVAAAMEFIDPDSEEESGGGLEVPKSEYGQSFADYDQAAQWMDAHWQNVLPVAVAMNNHQHYSDLVPFCSSVWRYFDNRGYYRQARELETLALSAARVTGSVVLEYQALHMYALTLWRLNEFTEANRLFNEVFELAATTGDVRMQCRARGNSGVTHWLKGESDEAIEHLGWVRETAHAHGSVLIEARARHRIGLIHTENRRYPEAAEELDQALRLAHDNESPDLEAECFLALGINSREVGDAALAVTQFTTAVEVLDSTGNRSMLPIAHKEMAIAFDILGERSKADRHRRFALRLYTDLGIADSAEVRELKQRLNDHSA